MQDGTDIQNQLANFEYPRLFLKILQLNLIDFEHWYLMDKTQVCTRKKGLLVRYPNRNLIPFARRNDCDNIACFEVERGEKVFIIHDFSSPGFEQEEEFQDFKDWFLHAISELLENEQ